MRALLLKALLVVTLAVGLTPALGVTWANACSCVGGDDETFAERADVVFTATLPANSRLGGGGSGPDPVTVMFAATRVHKGEVAAQQPIRTAASGASCGLELTGSGPFLVFAQRSPSGGGELRADLCGGTRAVGKKGVPAFLGPGRAMEAEPVSALGPSTDDEAEGSSNLGWVALAAGLLIAVGTVLTVRKRRHP